MLKSSTDEIGYKKCSRPGWNNASPLRRVTNGVIRRPATRYGFTKSPKRANNKCRVIPLPLKSGAVTITPKLEHPEPTSSPTPDAVGSINSLYSELGQGYTDYLSILENAFSNQKDARSTHKTLFHRRPCLLLQAIYSPFLSSTSSILHGPQFESVVAIGLKPLLLIVHELLDKPKIFVVDLCKCPYNYLKNMPP